MNYSSSLETGGQRFLSLCLQEALADAWLSPEDFAAAFSPEVVMTALERAPELRARLLVEAAGVHERIAPKKSTSAATEDLTIALHEGVCTPLTLIDLFGMDDRVRYLATDQLWTLLTRDNFWDTASERARSRMHFVISTALDQGLTSLGEIVDAVSPARLASDLPKALLERALTRAIESGRAGAAFNADAVFDALPLEDWVANVPLAHLWQKVTIERVLPVTGWVAFPKAPSTPSVAPSGQSPEAVVEKPSAEKSNDKKTKGGKAAEPAAAAPAAATIDDLPPPPASESEARLRAIENLKQLDRLPPRIDELPTATVLAIDGMYAELLSTSDEEERAQVIRDAFPNTAILEEALFAVAEALDPRLNRETLLSRGAGGDSLITLVLFEERRRASGRPAGSDRSTPSRPPAPVTSPVPPATTEKKSSVPPPPLPAVNRSMPAAPPPLPEGGRRSVPPPPLPAQSKGRG